MCLYHKCPWGICIPVQLSKFWCPPPLWVPYPCLGITCCLSTLLTLAPSPSPSPWHLTLTPTSSPHLYFSHPCYLNFSSFLSSHQHLCLPCYIVTLQSLPHLTTFPFLSPSPFTLIIHAWEREGRGWGGESQWNSEAEGGWKGAGGEREGKGKGGKGEKSEGGWGWGGVRVGVRGGGSEGGDIWLVVATCISYIRCTSSALRP